VTVAIITDQHFGARKNSKLFHDYFLKFYNEIFFPNLIRENIKIVIDMGDTFDNRTGINYSALAWAKDNYYDRLRDMGIKVYTIVGNHTAYYKNTNSINAVDLLLREYDNVEVISEYREIDIEGLKIAFVPWINSENQESTYLSLKKSKCPIVMGHLELQGFYANKMHLMDHGHDRHPYKKFEKVYSGHYHHRSEEDNIHYLGNPYEIYWNDLEDVRGFHLFDTKTKEHTPVDNPFKMFYRLYYDDNPAALLDSSEYKDKIVKLIVRKKTKPKEFEKYIDKLMDSGVFDLKVVENFAFNESEDFNIEQSEDTLSILSRYLDESETDIDKVAVKEIIKNIYQEACEVV
jgi:DNA repair exonuclease SbcCD nuclease subunit